MLVFYILGAHSRFVGYEIIIASSAPGWPSIISKVRWHVQGLFYRLKFTEAKKAPNLGIRFREKIKKGCCVI